MRTIAYLANEFPSSVERYVGEEIAELRRRGVRVVAGSVQRVGPYVPEAEASAGRSARATRAVDVIVRPVGILVLVQAVWLCFSRWGLLSQLVRRVMFRGGESPWQRLKALLHTVMGACYAVQLKKYEVEHIHVHHGYYGAWIGMVAARLLGTGFSLTLHGSDLLLHGNYLEAKLEACDFCFTVSEYNRHFIRARYPRTDPAKILVTRLGADVDWPAFGMRSHESASANRIAPFTILSVGRLHAVKNHAFLLRACAQLHARGVRFECSIAGEGPERKKLEALIRKFGLEEQVTLLGHVPREQMDSLYDRADAVVLTSRSEGIPLVLMEAMARGRVVLAPAITGIPELIVPGKTGFLYEPGSLGDLIARLMLIYSLDSNDRREGPRLQELLSARPLDWVRFGARLQVLHNFNRTRNLEWFGDLMLEKAGVAGTRSVPHADLVLQQI